MQTILERANAFFELRLNLSSRLLVVAAGLLLLGTFFSPLYTMTLISNQFPDGLVLNIHATRLEGGKTPNRDDLKEINSLNHYIGMRELKEDDFTEFKWIPFVIGGIILLALRVAVLGSMARLVDILVLFTYFGLFSLWSFYRKLYLYGHELDPTAAVKVPPFTPPIFGHQTMANFEVYNYPDVGSWLMTLVPVLLVAAIWISRRRSRPAA
jgi:hypothetical protein